MSIQAMSWAMAAQPASSTQKFVLVAVANYANEDGVAWPSQKRIATDTMLNRRTVQRCLEGLEVDGFIEREPFHREDGSRGTDKIHLKVVAQGGGSSPKGGGPVSRGQRSCVEEGGGPGPHQEPSPEPSPKPSSSLTNVREADDSDLKELEDHFWKTAPGIIQRSTGRPLNVCRGIAVKALKGCQDDPLEALLLIESMQGKREPVTYLTAAIAERNGTRKQRPAPAPAPKRSGWDRGKI